MWITLTVFVPVLTGLASWEMVLVPGLVVGSWGHPVLVVLVLSTVVVDDAPIMDVPRPEVYGASGLSQGCGVLSRSWGDSDGGIWVLLQGS